MVDINTYLGKEEKVLWKGRPDPKKAINKNENILAIIFSTIFLLFGINMFKNTYIESIFINLNLRHLAFTFFPLIMAFVPITFVVISIFKQRKELNNTVYYVTNKNIITVILGKNIKFRKNELINLDEIELVEDSFGSGKIIFKDDVYLKEYNRINRSNVKAYKGFSFLGIDNVGEVYKLIIDSKDKL